MNIQEEWNCISRKKEDLGTFSAGNIQSNHICDHGTSDPACDPLPELSVAAGNMYFTCMAGFVGLSAVVVIYIINKKQNPVLSALLDHSVLGVSGVGALFYLFQESSNT